MATCEHVSQIQEVTPVTPDGCTDCLKTGDEWVALRLCLVCGNVGCCDSSKNKHATKHFEATGHPVMQAYQEGKPWKWCYIDKVYID